MGTNVFLYNGESDTSVCKEMTVTGKALCGKTVFSCARSPDNIRQRLRVGRIIRNLLVLTEMEALFLLSKGLIYPESEEALDKFIQETVTSYGDVETFRVYSKLKEKGLFVRKEPDGLSFRKYSTDEYSRPLRIVSEASGVSFSDFYREHDQKWATVDDQGDVTFYITERYNPEGSAPNDNVVPKAVKILGEVQIVRSDYEAVGEPFLSYRVLSSYEKELISGNPTTQESKIFSDLTLRHCIVKTGFKYGCNFRVYLKNTDDHAELLISLMDEKELWFKISRAVRLATAVRKKMIYAAFYQNRPAYVWIRRVALDSLIP